MKKLFFFAASLFMAGSMMAQVNIDLSNGGDPVCKEEGDEIVLDYAAATGELTVTVTAGNAWGAPGVEFQLDEAVAVADMLAYYGSMKCSEPAEETTMIPYFVDENGLKMFQSDCLPGTTEFADWAEFTAYPDAYLWEGEEADPANIPSSSIVAVGMLANAETPLASYVFYLKEVMLITNGSGIIEVMNDHKVTKAMINGQLVIIRNGEVFNALGAAL